MDWPMLLGAGVIALIGGLALAGRLRGRRLVMMPPGRVKAEPLHRQAIHHFTSGVLPPWR